jgi:methionyl-tRNA synthetase
LQAPTRRRPSPLAHEKDLEAIFNLVGAANRFVEDTKPWALARAEGDGDGDASQRLDRVLWNLAECLRLVAEALRPFLPETADRIAAHLGVTLAVNWTEALQWGVLPAGGQLPCPCRSSPSASRRANQPDKVLRPAGRRSLV